MPPWLSAGSDFRQLQVPTWLALKATRRDSTAASPAPFCWLWVRFSVCSHILLPWSHSGSTTAGRRARQGVGRSPGGAEKERLSMAGGTQLHSPLKRAQQYHLQKLHLLNPASFDLCPHNNSGRATESSLMCSQCNKVTPLGIISPAITVPGIILIYQIAVESQEELRRQ